MNLVSLQGTKPSLFDLWTMYQLDMGKLNIMAGVPVGTVYAMIGNQPVRRENAQKVLDKLSTLFHQEYTLETVYVALIEEGSPSFGGKSQHVPQPIELEGLGDRTNSQSVSPGSMETLEEEAEGSFG